MQWREVSFHCAAVDRDRDVPSAALLYNGGRDAPVRYPKPDLVLKRRGVSPLRHHEPCLSGMNRFRRMPVAVLIGTWEVGDAPTFQDPVGFREDGLGRLYGTALPPMGVGAYGDGKGAGRHGPDSDPLGTLFEPRIHLDEPRSQLFGRSGKVFGPSNDLSERPGTSSDGPTTSSDLP